MIYKLLAQVQTGVADSLTNAKIAQNAVRFNEIDPWGVGMTFIGMAVVFLSLLLLYLLFYNITRALLYQKKRASKVKGGEAKEAAKEVKELTGEVNVAIATALHLYFAEAHDHESAVLTINRVGRMYSPWSSKIYGMRQNP